MYYFIGLSPILLFVVLYVGSGIYFTILGVDKAFYQLSPVAAILPPIALAWVLHQNELEEKMRAFLDGVRHTDIITMCIIFLLAGAFSTVTNSIGSVDAAVNLTLSLVSQEFLLIGLFIASAFIGTAIGTSVGTIATLAPIVAGLSTQGACPAALGAATVVGGAMFGDNLSIISDTTIASVMSQEADMKSKLKLNAFIALLASIITICILFYNIEVGLPIPAQDYSLFLVSPYIFLLILAVSGVNVFVTLVLSLAYAGAIGCVTAEYDPFLFTQDIAKGFASVQDIMLLALLVGGLSGLTHHSTKQLTVRLSGWISKFDSPKLAQLVIAKIVSVLDILLANNTIAIIISGEMVRDIAKRHRIAPHYSAAWLDIFSCVFQGIIPYGAQVLLASSIVGVSPLGVVPHVYYCYVLGLVSIIFILIHNPKMLNEQ